MCMYKLWLIYLMYFFTYNTYNITDDNYNTKYFSITQRRGMGKQAHYITLTAEKNEATGIYSFDDKKFVTMDEMLDYIISK